ncbi:uncharacterized protein [Rhodnius prolixus]|uniref:uncharacterized protein n=1 Tax=Rhodnius prolixus TaxID=13249 RepID=UPI003D189255
MLDIFEKPKWMQTSLARQLFASLSCYLCVMTASFSFNWLSPYTIKLTSGESPVLTPTILATLISVIEIGEAVTCIPVAIFSDRFGRKISLLWIGPLTASLWILSLFTKNTVVLYIIRLLQGVVMAAIETVVPVYLAEISGAERRGALGGYYSVFWNLGVLGVYINSEYLSFDMYTLVSIVVPILFFTTFIFMPESPYFYLMTNQLDDAKLSLQWLRHGEDIKEEYEQIEEAVREDMKNAGSWKDLVATKKDRRSLLIVLVVCLSRYLIGTAVFVIFAEDIFAKAGQHMFTANQQAIGLAVLFTIGSAVASFFSDTVGRRKLLIYSLIGTAISNIIIIVYFCILELTSLQVTPYVWVMYIGIVGFCIFTSIGLGQLMPTIKAEFFPSHTRSKGGAITNLACSLAVFVQISMFPVISMYVGMYFNFVIFSIVAVIGCIFVIIFLPESAGKTLHEVVQSVDTKRSLSLH